RARAREALHCGWSASLDFCQAARLQIPEISLAPDVESGAGVTGEVQVDGFDQCADRELLGDHAELLEHGHGLVAQAPQPPNGRGRRGLTVGITAKEMPSNSGSLSAIIIRADGAPWRHTVCRRFAVRLRPPE